MISHALQIVANELNRHLRENYGSEWESAKLGNLAEGFSESSGMARNHLYISVANIKEEKTLKNLPNRLQPSETSSPRMKVSYQNPPVFINLLVLFSAAHIDYFNALSMLSRTIRFFQQNNVFTQDSVAKESLEGKSSQLTMHDRLESFKLIFDLYSPTMEEVNHLWGILGGKQYPFVLYLLRMLDLQFKTAPQEGEVVHEIVSSFSLKDS